MQSEGDALACARGPGPVTRRRAALQRQRDWAGGLGLPLLARALAFADFATRARAAAVCKAWRAAATDPDAWAVLDLSDDDLARVTLAAALARAEAPGYSALRCVAGFEYLSVENGERIAHALTRSSAPHKKAEFIMEFEDPGLAARALAAARDVAAATAPRLAFENAHGKCGEEACDARLTLVTNSATAIELLDAHDADRAAWPASARAVTLYADDVALTERACARFANLPCVVNLHFDAFFEPTNGVMSAVLAAVRAGARVGELSLRTRSALDAHLVALFTALRDKCADVSELTITLSDRLHSDDMLAALAALVARAPALTVVYVFDHCWDGRAFAAVADALARRSSESKTMMHVSLNMAIRPNRSLCAAAVDALAAMLTNCDCYDFSLRMLNLDAASKRRLAHAVARNRRCPTVLRLRSSDRDVSEHGNGRYFF